MSNVAGWNMRLTNNIDLGSFGFFICAGLGYSLVRVGIFSVGVCILIEVSVGRVLIASEAAKGSRNAVN